MERQGGGQEVGDRFLMVEFCGRARGSGQKSKQERFKLDTRKNFPLEDSKVVEQVAHKGCSVSVFEGFQELAGLSCE